MTIQPINSIDIHDIRRVLTSNNLTYVQKAKFMRTNQTEIQKVMETEVSTAEFKYLMDNRPLIKFRPLKNSFTKNGDKILLAKTLGIKPSEVDDYIKKTKDFINDLNDLDFLPQSYIESLKTYVYRHGSIDGVVSFLDYELKHSKDIIKTLYNTLEYHTGGVADYFVRPIHRMSNPTMVRLYGIIDKNIQAASSVGAISEEDYNKIARWALIRIYQIQNNSKLINAIKTYKVLNK